MNESFEISALDESVHEEEVQTLHRCETCPHTTSFRQNLKRHIKTKHTATQLTAEIMKPLANLMCEHCGRGFKSKYGLKSHVKSRHEITFRLQCDACGRGFQRLWNLRGHLRSHSKAHPYPHLILRRSLHILHQF